MTYNIEHLKEDMTKGCQARSIMIEITEWFMENETMTKDDYFRLSKIGNEKTKEMFFEEGGCVNK